jgi:hypothetical protein
MSLFYKLIRSTPVYDVLFGACMCYTIQNEKYLDIPLIILSPPTYFGYQCYSNKDKILEWIRK